MNTDAILSSFSGLPGFSPMMMINISGQCATTRLLQCTGFGLYMNDISRKFDQDPDAVQENGDLDRGEFVARRDVVRRIRRWNSRHISDRAMQWTPILYAYEVVSNSARRAQDWGHMLFTNATLTQFLVVMIFGPPTCPCGDPFHNDYAALTKMQAERILCLAKYVYSGEHDPKVKWVHATYTTWDQPLQADVFLANTSSGSSSANPPIFHINADDVPGALTSSELDKIDNMLRQNNGDDLPPRSLRDAVTRKMNSAKTLAASGGTGNFAAAQTKTEKECANCRNVAVKMMVCSKCKLVSYCNRECQANHWKYHKVICKRASARPQAQAQSEAQAQTQSTHPQAESQPAVLAAEPPSATSRPSSPTLSMPGAFHTS